MAADLIAVFEFQDASGDTRIVSEKHYRLVKREDISDEDLRV